MKNTRNVTTPGDREVMMTRVFNAPRPAVWDTMVKPALIIRWLSGPPGWAMTACENDLRVGGTFRWTWRSLKGAEMTMSGVYRDIVAPAWARSGPSRSDVS